jgi:hypothetical protein
MASALAGSTHILAFHYLNGGFTFSAKPRTAVVLIGCYFETCLMKNLAAMGTYDYRCVAYGHIALFTDLLLLIIMIVL